MMRNKDGQAAASCYDMARVYGENGKWTEAMSALKWIHSTLQRKTNLQRVFNNNVYAMKISNPRTIHWEYKRVVDENEYPIKRVKSACITTKVCGHAWEISKYDYKSIIHLITLVIYFDDSLFLYQWS